MMNPKNTWLTRVGYITLGFVMALSLPAAAKLINQDAVYKWLTVFAEALEHIENQYVESIPQEKLARGAIEGLVQQLDPQSKFYTPEEFKSLMEQTKGEYGGIGVELGRIDNQHRILSILPNSPADQAGLEAQDSIITVNQKVVTELSTEKLHRLLTGTVKTQVVLGIMRETFVKPWTFTLTRDWVNRPSFKLQELEPDIIYVNVRLFSRGLGRALEKQLLGPSRPKAVILDLRDNPGGLFDEAVKVANIFLESGTIVRAEGRNQTILEVREATAKRTLTEPPLAVLMNQASASASEILAGALQDHKRAQIFGSTSYGKGSVQNIIDLSDGSGLKITVARYLTPSGKSIEGQGIKPDVSVTESEDRDNTLETSLRWLKSQL